ncbi:MAG: ABC transporter ATP-binding protein [Anaerolineae bacterium]|nr:MAG: ABC transporter ATP-binding protein [Anaerolineae bacterium]
MDGVNLDVLDGEFFTFLGPSGSGKTTCLRMVAGFDRPTSGRIFLHGDDVSELPPYERDVNTVFQDYALFPHMTVLDNVAYGLTVRKAAREQRTRRAEEMLDLVRLPGLGKRKPSQLSGGQRQRVALARALILRPRVLLLDEPLGALDLKLRQEMQVELKALQEQVGITFIYVTHDQEEALTMSDRLAVFSHGRIEQVGSPAEIYESPATEFVAGFVGISNLVRGDVARGILGTDTTFSVRPEKIHILEPDAAVQGGMDSVRGRIEEVIYLGMYTRFEVALEGGGKLTVAQQNLETSSMDVHTARGREVRLVWEKSHSRKLGGQA